MFENPKGGRQAGNFTTNVPKILDLKSSSEQILVRNFTLGAPAFLTYDEKIHFWKKSLHDHYFELLKERSDYEIGWINHVNHDESAFEHIEPDLP